MCYFLIVYKSISVVFNSTQYIANVHIFVLVMLIFLQENCFFFDKNILFNSLSTETKNITDMPTLFSQILFAMKSSHKTIPIAQFEPPQKINSK